MQKELLKIADGFSSIAEALKAIAKENGRNEEDGAENKLPDSVKVKGVKQDGDNSGSAKDSSPQIGIEDIRAVLAEKSQDGKSKEVKALLNQYGVAKLSAVEEKDYPALFQKAKVL